MTKRRILPALAAPLLLTACVTGGGAGGDAARGAALGGLAGAVIGNNVSDGDAKTGAAIGAAAGAIGGAAYGDRQRGRSGTYEARRDEEVHYDRTAGRYYTVDRRTGATYWENGDLRTR
ncbi:glycine zipper domain-containing protein [Parvularcula oceani]|uniref:glycine zipper domain-containing protein n=1 Tax=Parvularcula oceani TaxID=1247963 RepID=UPI00056ABE0A|nr:glycine zipper domain-containing protein [Parvularcula oceani]